MYERCVLQCVLDLEILYHDHELNNFTFWKVYSNSRQLFVLRLTLDISYLQRHD